MRVYDVPNRNTEQLVCSWVVHRIPSTHTVSIVYIRTFALFDKNNIISSIYGWCCDSFGRVNKKQCVANVCNLKSALSPRHRPMVWTFLKIITFYSQPVSPYPDTQNTLIFGFFPFLRNSLIENKSSTNSMVQPMSVWNVCCIAMFPYVRVRVYSELKWNKIK